MDLGFSALSIDPPDTLKDKTDAMILTFVDNPGHNSLIRTIIGGNLIIDMMLLVIDIQKGFEPQTGECLILGEISRKPLIAVLNKIDMIEETKRELVIDKMTKKVSKTLESTIFRTVQIIPVSATKNVNIDMLVKVIKDEISKLKLIRLTEAPFIFAFDHCFTIKGTGSVLSGTVLQGTVKVHDTIEIPSLKIDRKVKSMQMFRKPIEKAVAGDRIGLCITNFDAKLLERGLTCAKGTVDTAYATVIKLNKIKYFKRDIKSKSKFHCSIGHETVMAKIIIFSAKSREFDFETEYQYEDMIIENDNKDYFVLLEFEHPVLIYDGMLIIALKLDTEQTNACRLAFYGHVAVRNSSVDKASHDQFLSRLKIYKQKSREGNVQRIVNESEVIVENLFKKETDRSKFERMKCQLSTGESGIIVGSFGQSAKVKVQFSSPLCQATVESIKTSKDVKVQLSFKKFVFDKKHKMVQ